MNTETAAQENGSKKGVLLMDDDKFLLDMYSMKFTAAGFTVHACLSVKEALETLRDGFQADAIVFDLVMPEQDGFTFLQALEAEHLAQNAVKIALTNQGRDEERAKAESMGASRYILKASMIPSEVVEAVGQELTKKH